MINRLPIVGVMGSHEEQWAEYAQPLGELIAKSGYHLLTGAGHGVMEAVSEAFTKVKEREGLCVGVVPIESIEDYPAARQRHENPYVELPIITLLDSEALGDAMPYSRNMLNIMTSDAVIALPGMRGTQNEVSLCLQFKRPMILFGPDAPFQTFPEDALRAEGIEEVAKFLKEVAQKTMAVKHGG